MFPEIIEIPAFIKKSIPPDSILMDKLNILIEKHFKSNKAASFYAESLNLSVKVLNIQVKQCTGKTLHELLQHRLYKEAVYLILETNKSIKEISYELGMYDPAYFSRFFKKITGVQPKHYKMFRKTRDLLF